MWRSTLERRLAVGVLVLFVIPGVLGAAALVAFQATGGAERAPAGLGLGVATGFAAAVAALGAIVYVAGRSWLRGIAEIHRATELMATVNPGHRVRVDTDDELGALAAEINRMADRVDTARRGLEAEIARATHELRVERSKLSAVLEALGEGVSVATSEGRITLANRAAQALLAGPGGGLLGRNLFEFVDRETVDHFLQRLPTTEWGAVRFTLHPPGGGVLESVMTPFLDDDRQRIGFILILRDVTRPARTDDERQRVVTQTLRELRGSLASVRSLSESLLGDPSLAVPDPRRLLEAIHAEAVRLSEVVRAMGEPTRSGLVGRPRHFETLSVRDLAAMTLRRLAPELRGAVQVESDGDWTALPVLNAEASSLSEALACLLGAALARRRLDGTIWFRPKRRGHVLQIDTGTEGGTSLSELEVVLDAPMLIGLGRAVTVRTVIHQHAGEVWGYADGVRLGFQVTLPAAEPGETFPDPAPNVSRRFVGAGTTSGLPASPGVSERPDFYDFSLFEEMARHVSAADRERSLDDLHCVVFDLETTGLEPDGGDRIVSLAGVCVRGGAVKRGETFDALVDPQRPIPERSVAFHGISDAMVADAPPLDPVLAAFRTFAEGAVLVGHQVWFDVRFLSVEGARLGRPPITFSHPVLDTRLLSELVHGAVPDHGLDAVAQRLGVSVRGRHSALGDALATAEIFVRLVPLLKKRGIVTLGQALDAARAVQATRADDLRPGAGP